MNHAPKSTEVFDQLIAALTDIRDNYVLDTDRFDNPLDTVEGYRYVAQVLSAASELFVEGDPEYPRFASIVTPARKLQGDNPDAIYQFARIRGDRSYRITGVLDQECYTSFTIHGRAEDGGMAGPLLGDVNNRDFDVADDGSYELILSAQPPESGNWIKLEPTAHSVVVRSYFALEPSAQNDAGVNVNIDIRSIPSTTIRSKKAQAEGLPTPAPLTDDALSERLAEAVAFVRQATVGQIPPSAESDVPFVSNVPNDVATPFSFRDSGLPVPGAADIFYSMGRWNLGPDEALVMTGTLPEGPFVNVMLWNRHMQTIDYRNRRSALNQNQVQLEADGTYRIVVAHSDPGVANWLDVEGHQEGSIFWRYLLPETDPGKPECTVMPLSEVK